MKEVKKYWAEALGTFALVFIGAGAVLSAVQGSEIGTVGVALAHGLVLMCVVYAVGHISGAHVNPAVTFAMWITGKIQTSEALTYVVSQLIGAAFAGLALLSLFNVPEAVALGTPAISSDVTLWQAFFVEAVLTFFLAWMVLSTTDKKFPAAAAGLCIGLVLTFGILVGGHLTGGAMNPARAFGPALVSGQWANHLIYWAGPFLGAFVAAMVDQYIMKAK